MHEQLKQFWKDKHKDYLMQPITFWFKHPKGDYRNDETGVKGFTFEKVKGFTFEKHIGLQNVKDLAGEGLYVYALRHGDDWCEPASIEKDEVIVNFFAYFVTDKPLDHLFKDGKDWAECLHDWSWDWNGEYYWE